jgi:hypothetical protein
MNPVFIMGFSRTGSTLLQQILNKYSEVVILPELHLLWPRRLHADFTTTVRRQVGNRITEKNIDHLIDLMFSKTLRGVFWKHIDKHNIDRQLLKQKIMDSERSIKNIFDVLLEIKLLAPQKKIAGAKFPVHYSYINRLLKWYPNCKIIHTVRDPRAIFASQYYKHLRRAGRITKFFTGIIQFIHVNVSLRGIRKFHDKMKGLQNYYIIRYEDLVTDPEKTLNDLAHFLNIQFKENMANPEVFQNTSLEERKIGKGIYNTSIHAWKEKLPKSINSLLLRINKKFMHSFGYI